MELSRDSSYGRRSTVKRAPGRSCFGNRLSSYYGYQDGLGLGGSSWSIGVWVAVKWARAVFSFHRLLEPVASSSDRSSPVHTVTIWRAILITVIRITVLVCG